MYFRFRNIKKLPTLFIIFYIYFFEMSIITVNNSLLDYQARTKSHSKHMRNYQKVSQSNLDDSSIISYLKSHNLTKTLAAFLLEINSKKSVEPILEIFLKGGNYYEGNIEQYWSIIQKSIHKKHQSEKGTQKSLKSQKIIKLEFYIYIWYCMNENQLNPSRMSILKQFIDSKGDILSEIPQLLSFFALPYIDKRVSNPILKKVLSEQWKMEVKNLLQQLIGVENDTMEQQWFNIIADMIEICDQLIKKIDIQNSSHNLKAMIERMTLYKTVLQKNKTDKKSQVSSNKEDDQSLLNKQILLNMNDVKTVKQTLQGLNKSAFQKGDSSLVKMINVYKKVQKQIAQKYKVKEDKAYINQLVSKDILFIKKGPNYLWSEYQWLKLLQIMSGYHKCRSFLSSNSYFIDKIIEVAQIYFSKKQSQHRIQMLDVTFGILHRVMIRQPLFEMVNKNDKIYVIAISLIKQYEFAFETNYQIGNLFELILAFVLSIVIHRKGRSKISKMHIFQLLVGILSRLTKTDNTLSIQSLISSIIYLLLVQQHIRKTAIRLNLKDILLNRMLDKKQGGYDTIVQYIIERIQRDDEESEIDSDEDIVNEEEFDENITIHDEIYICRNECLPQQMPQNRTNKQKQPIVPVVSLAKQNNYVQQHYNWKKKWLRP